MAGTEEGNGTNAYWFDSIIEKSADFPGLFFEAGYNVAVIIQPALSQVFLLFVLIMSVYYALKFTFAAGGMSSVMEGMFDMIRMILVIGGVLAMLKPDLYYELTKAIWDGFVWFERLASERADALVAGGEFKQAGAGIKLNTSMFTQIQAALEEAKANLSWYDLPEYLSIWTQQIKMTVFIFILFLSQLVLAVIYLFLNLIVAFYLGLAIMFGPLMIIFYAFPPLSYIADGWLRFFIATGFMKLIITGVLVLFGVVISAVVNSSIRETLARIEAETGVKQTGVTADTALEVARSLTFSDLAGLIVVLIPTAFILLSAPEISDKMLAGTRVGGGVGGGASGGASYARQQANSLGKGGLGNAAKALQRK